MAVASSTSMASTTMVASGAPRLASSAATAPRDPVGASSSASLSSTKSPAGSRWVGSRTGTSRAARRGWMARAGRSTTKVVRLALTGPAAPVASATTVRGTTTPARWSASPCGRATRRRSRRSEAPGAIAATAGRNSSSGWVPAAALGVASRPASSERVSTGWPRRALTTRPPTGTRPRLRTVTR